MSDLHHLLPRYREDQQDEILTRVLLERDAPPERLTPERKYSKHDTWSPEELRGIPVCGEGVGGVIPGTNPEAACVRKLAA